MGWLPNVNEKYKGYLFRILHSRDEQNINILADKRSRQVWIFKINMQVLIYFYETTSSVIVHFMG